MVNITDLGRVLTAMAIAADRCDSRANANNALAYALRAGATKCAEIAKEQLDGTVDIVPIEPEWIKWSGKRSAPNIPRGSSIQLRFRNGTFFTTRAPSQFNWLHRPLGDDLDIIEYRLIDKPEQTS